MWEELKQLLQDQANKEGLGRIYCKLTKNQLMPTQTSEHCSGPTGGPCSSVKEAARKLIVRVRWKLSNRVSIRHRIPFAAEQDSCARKLCHLLHFYYRQESKSHVFSLQSSTWQFQCLIGTVLLIS